MGDAGQALKQNDLGDAGDQEGRAVENLRQGARSMAEQMMRSGGQRGGGQANRDPLGRKQGDKVDDGDSVKVPSEITVERAAPSWMRSPDGPALGSAHRARLSRTSRQAVLAG